jgi:hypothetical protein
VRDGNSVGIYWPDPLLQYTVYYETGPWTLPLDNLTNQNNCESTGPYYGSGFRADLSF